MTTCATRYATQESMWYRLRQRLCLEPIISWFYGQYGIFQDVAVVIASTITRTCSTMDVLQILLDGLVELHVHSMSLGIVLLICAQICHLSLV